MNKKMRNQKILKRLHFLMRCRVIMMLVFILALNACAKDDKKAAPSGKPVPLVFVHHSCGENWLSDDNGGLAEKLTENNYFVSDTNYGWGPDGIGDRTDITNWTEWFCSPRSSQILKALYGERETHSPYSRSSSDPGGENRIIMFKSCFPNSNLEGKPNDSPKKSGDLSVGNAKAVYKRLLDYFITRPDKLFVVITAPPLQDTTNAKNARAFNSWLVKEWLAKYKGGNVFVFDFYNVLTAPGNHHRISNGQIEYRTDSGGDVLHYPSDDTHPSAAGNKKATAEFIPLLNYYFKQWQKNAPATKLSASKFDGKRKNTLEKIHVVEKEKASSSPQKTSSVKQPVSPLPSGVFDNFESASPKNWQVFKDCEKAGSKIKFSSNSKTPASGKAALEIIYDIVPESYATCASTYSSPRDWKQSKGISLKIVLGKSTGNVRIAVYQGKATDALRLFEYTLKIPSSHNNKWYKIDIPWKKFKQPDWQGDPSILFNPEKAMGLAIIFHSDSKKCAGKVLFDDIVFMKSD